MHTGVQHGKVFAFDPAVHEEYWWINCMMATEIILQMSHNGLSTEVQSRGWASEQKMHCTILFSTNKY